MPELSAVPRWALDQAWQAGGRRGPKRERTYTTGRQFDHSQAHGPMRPWIWDEHRRIFTIPPSNTSTGKISREQRATAKGFEIPRANITSNELRYWYGAQQEFSNFRACRCCEATCVSTWQIKEHSKNQPFDDKSKNSCFKLLDLAYKLLLRDQKCVVCGTHTLWEKWGVPLCKHASCVSSWLFVPKPMPDALEDKLLQVSLSGGVD